MIDIPSLEQNISGSIGTHGSMTDVPSLELGAIHKIFLFILGLMDQQGTSSRDGIIILLFYSVYKTIQNSNQSIQ